ncbi:GPI-anchored cell surface glycoprotein [Talaromyces pinophilus]|uniref:GPI-anchored cell surface glycoprotein n=1 Tax=Talaromyces pinophilus TaxID=128442 RepID=A0A6V8HAH9_TALPI|nr:GPI-anchored cell surface glycoprotein [Talaromyces pinophilus]
MAAHEDMQKSSSMPSTPQSFLYYETDSPFPQSGNEELWHSSKRRRTQQRPSSETQFIHMNGYKSDSQLGTRFNNTYVDSYSDSKTFENTQNKSGDAASVPEDTAGAAAETASKASDDLLEVSSAKSVRSARKPMERSTETSQRLLKVKSGAGSSQPTNIQTFIFKTKLDPRNIGNRDRSDEPGTPSSVNETSEVQMENPPAEPSTRSTRKTRKSEVSNMLKFKSYTPNATPVLRGNASRKTPRQEQSVDAESPAPTIADDQVSMAAFEQERQLSPDKTTQHETPMKDDSMGDLGDSNSAQRRSTRVRKPAKTVLLEELAKETPRKEKSTKEQGSTTAAQSSKSLSKSANTNVAEPASYASPPARQSDASYPYSDAFDRYGTPSPDGLSNTRSSGRVRKPTIKAIEALQSKPHSRKRLRNSDQFVASGETTISQGKGTPEPANTVTTSTVPTSRSASGGSSDALSVSIDENDILGRQLYDLASTAIVETTSVEDEEAKIAEWREAFNKKRNDQVSTPIVEEVTEVPEATEPEPEPEAPAKETLAVIEYLNLPGEINTDIPLDHPQRPRPFTEGDGWMHTGRVNEHGEEYCVAPAEKYQWVKHASNYKTPIGPIPTPPPVLKSVDEIRRDNIYGFPPSPGKRNMYQKHPGQVWRFENVDGLVSQTPTHTKSLRSSDRSVAKQVDAMNVDESGMKTRYIHKKGFPRFKRPLKIVFVDSSKLDLPAPSESTASLRRRRQRAPLFAGGANSTPSKTRKRSFDMTSGSHGESSEQAQPQRKKRQSNVKVDDKSTPARPKRHSTVGSGTINSNKSGGPSTPATAPPKSTSSGAKPTGGISLKFHFGSHKK